MLLGPLSMKSWMVWCKAGDSRGGASTPNSQSPLITKLGTIMQHCDAPPTLPNTQSISHPTYNSLQWSHIQCFTDIISSLKVLQWQFFVGSNRSSLCYCGLGRFPNLLGTVTVIFMTVGEPDFYTPSQFHQPTCFWKLLKWGGKLVYYTPSPCKIFTQPSTILSSVVWVSALYIESLKYHQELRLLIWYFSGNCLIFCQFYTVLGEQNYPILCGLCKTGRTPCQTRVRPSTACHYQISPIRGRCPD